jgi:hypothetical protein
MSHNSVGLEGLYQGSLYSFSFFYAAKNSALQELQFQFMDFCCKFAGGTGRPNESFVEG